MHIALNEGLQGLPYLLLLMEKMTEECYYLLRMPFLLQSDFCKNVDKISVVFYEQQLGPFFIMLASLLNFIVGCRIFCGRQTQFDMRFFSKEPNKIWCETDLIYKDGLKHLFFFLQTFLG